MARVAGMLVDSCTHSLRIIDLGAACHLGRRAGPLLGAMLAALLPTRDASWQRDRDICHVRRLLSGCCLASIRCPIPSAPRPLGWCQLARRHAARLTVRSGDVAHASDGAGSGRKRSSSAYADQVQARRRAREWVGGSVGPHLLDAALGEPARSVSASLRPERSRALIPVPWACEM